MFKLSRLTDYAVVVLSEMYRTENDLISVSGLSNKTGLTVPTVAKILKLLARGGVVDSVRGAAGGYKVKNTADEVSVLDVITALEGPLAIVACADGSTDQCALESACMMRGRWQPVNAALKEALSEVSLQALMGETVSTVRKVEKTEARI